MRRAIQLSSRYHSCRVLASFLQSFTVLRVLDILQDFTNQVGVANGPFVPGLVSWPDPNKIGDETTNYYYYVRAVTVDGYGNEVLSAPSNHIAEFDFKLVPGT